MTRNNRAPRARRGDGRLGFADRSYPSLPNRPTQDPASARTRSANSRPESLKSQDASLDDAHWFARHFGRNYRLREPIDEERRLCHPEHRSLILVKQFRPGVRVRSVIELESWSQEPLNSEVTAAALFRLAFQGSPTVARIERLIAELSA